jgi:hypothetical protein
MFQKVGLQVTIVSSLILLLDMVAFRCSGLGSVLKLRGSGASILAEEECLFHTIG